MSSNQLNILLTSNKKYVKYASVLINSIISNNPASVSVYYVYNDEDAYDLKLLRDEVIGKGVDFFIITPDEKMLSFLPRTSSLYSIECYWSLFPHLYLPSNLNRIMYLDIDTIVDGNIMSFYETDFEDKILIASNQRPGYYPQEPFDPQKKARGAYFNSGVIIYNLEKMRNEIPLEYYNDVLQNSEKYFFDQGMLNALFCEKTKYVETMNYNYRFTIAKAYRDFAPKPEERKIIHYICSGTPYKPWDFYLSDQELASIKGLPAFAGGNMFYIDKFINDLLRIWWKYAESSAFYKQLFYEMNIKKEYILRFGIIDRINNNYKKYKNLENKYLWYERNNKLLFKDYILQDDIQKIDDIKHYFEYLAGHKNYMLLIACKDTASTYFKQFCEISNLGFEPLKYRQSMVSVVCEGEILYCEYSMNPIVYNMAIDVYKDSKGIISNNASLDMLPVCTLMSQGYEEKEHTSIASMMINNIDYSPNKIGLNCVVYDCEKKGVVDSFNLNTHRDVNLKISRDR